MERNDDPVWPASEECYMAENKSMPVTLKYEEKGIQIF